MSSSSIVSLGAIRLQAQDRADLENSPNISTAMWNQYISLSYKELYDLLIAAYGNDYSVQTPYQFTIAGTQFYNLPADFYKLLGVDVQYSASPTGWVTLKRFEFIERNKYSWLNPIPITSSLAQLWYIPKPTSLQFSPTCATILGSTTVSMTDVSDISAGMSVSGSGILDSTTVVSVDSNLNTLVLSQAATLTQPIVTLFFWTDAVTIDGISGWEEYVIVDAAIKANIKQEQPIQELSGLKNDMLKRIESMAEGRDAGQAIHVSDAMSVNSPILQIGAAGLRYRLVGSQIQFCPVGYENDYDSGYGAGYGGFY